jgi:uncharacterized protein (TIGR00369 family)
MDGFAGFLGLTDVTAADGQARAEFDAQEHHLNPAGTVHGGVLATLVDTTMGAAVRSSTGEDETPATSQLSLVYLRPGRTGRLAVQARVRQQGQHLLVCEADVEQDGKALVQAVATFAVLDR